MFCKHKFLEVYRSFGGEPVYGGFSIERIDSINQPLTCITLQCDKCGKYKQTFLKGHVLKDNSIPEIFRKLS